VDEYDDPLLTYYDCKDGACTEIYDLKCNRTCDHKLFDFGAVNVVILQVTLGQDGILPNKQNLCLVLELQKLLYT
jgi:hypothetical protein